MDKNSVESTKQSRPNTSDVLPRERLFGILDRLMEHRIVWIGGSAGAGKSTLIASYLEDRQIPASWYQIDAQDGDPTAHMLRDLYNRLPQGGALVLDDCHEPAPDSPLHALLADSARQIPAGVNIILIGRGEPPGVYTRLIASRTLAVLDPRDLHFTLDETRALASGISIDALALGDLHAQCGGWVAGIAITIDRLRRNGGGPSDVQYEVRKTAFDYFAGEVFDRATREERAVLVSTALLARVSADEAREISGRSQAQALLNRLASRHLFTCRTSGTPSTYEYTPLLREFLLTRIEATLAENELRDVVGRAGAILEQRGELDASVALHVRTQDWESVLGVICRHGMRLLAQGHSKIVRNWIAAFPADLVSNSGWLRFWSGTAMISESHAAARTCLERAWTRFEQRGDGDGQLLAAAAIVETYQFEWSSYGPALRWIERLRAAVTSNPTYPSAEAELRVLANLLFALTCVRGAPDLMATCSARLRALIDGDLDVNHRLFAARSVLIASAQMDGGSYRDLVGRMRSMLQEKGCSAQMRASALNAIAYSLCIEGNASEADLALEEGIGAVGHPQLTSQDPLHHLTRQLLASARRDLIGIADCIQALRRAMDPTCHLGMSMLSRALAEQSVLRGEPSAAVNHLLTAASRADEACARPMQWISRLALSACLAGQNDCAGAARVLQETRSLQEGSSSEVWHRDCELVAAYAALRRDDRVECHRLLCDALAASPYAPGASQVFTLLPSAMAELCVEALRSAIAVESVRGLIQHYRLPPPADAGSEWPWPFKVFVLGRFRVLKADSPIRCKRRGQIKPLELLQVLIAFGGIEVGAGVLSDALWPDSEGDIGYHNLESALYRLRQLLGSPEAVLMAGGKLSLNPKLIWVDMWTFETALQTLAARGVEATRHIARMRQLYVGHFLEQEYEKRWALKRRQALRDKFVRSIRDVARTSETHGHWQEAANVYQAGIELDSLSEDLHRGLIVCHLELGDHAEALQAYRRCRDLLVGVLGVEPNAKTLAIYQSVRQNALGQSG
jgi:LuxR family transcriptional regulator, maltose regulon positive regulatory protein